MLSFRNFAILDFGASQPHTHHQHSILSFANLLEENNVPLKVFLPLGSELKFPNYIIKRKLFPSSHSVKFSMNRLSSWLPSIFYFVIDKLSKSKRELSLVILDFLSNTIALISFKQINSHRNRCTDILFPTLCPLTIKLIMCFEKKQVAMDFYVRLTNTSERRGPLAHTINLRNFISWADQTRFVNVNFGYEMEKYFKSLEVKNPRIFHSPFPSIYKSPVKKSVQIDSQTIGFLGFPKEIKGYSKIQDIILNVAKFRTRDVIWFLQVRTEDEALITDLPPHIKVNILVGRLTRDQLTSAVANCSLLCLPYDPKSYGLNASAMAYEAADCLVPVICLAGSAFSEEIERFKLGYVCDSIDDLIKKIITLKTKDIAKLKQHIDYYNSYRIDANLNFLNLKESK